MTTEWYRNPDGSAGAWRKFWVPNYILERAKVHDFEPAKGGSTTCRNCGFVLTMQTVYDLRPLCLVKEQPSA